MTGKKLNRTQVGGQDQVRYDNLVEVLKLMPELDERIAKLETLVGQMAMTVLEIYGRLILLEREVRGTAEQDATAAAPPCDPHDHP